MYSNTERFWSLKRNFHLFDFVLGTFVILETCNSKASHVHLKLPIKDQVHFRHHEIKIGASAPELERLQGGVKMESCIAG